MFERNCLCTDSTIAKEMSVCGRYESNRPKELLRTCNTEHKNSRHRLGSTSCAAQPLGYIHVPSLPEVSQVLRSSNVLCKAYLPSDEHSPSGCRTLQRHISFPKNKTAVPETLRIDACFARPPCQSSATALPDRSPQQVYLRGGRRLYLFKSLQWWTKVDKMDKCVKR